MDRNCKEQNRIDRMTVKYPDGKMCSFCGIVHLITSEFWYNGECRARARARSSKYYQNDPKSHNEKCAIRYQQNRERYQQLQRNYEKKEMETNEQFRISRNLRLRLREWLKGNETGRMIEKYTGCSKDFLRQYFENKFYEDMSWENYGKVWCIDHIIPLNGVDLTFQVNLYIVCHYSNLQPLLLVDNAKKRAEFDLKYIRSAQKHG